MSLLNKDFVTPNERINNGVMIRKESPLHLAKIYLAAEREAIDKFKAGEKVSDRELESEVVKVLCRWSSDKFNNFWG